MNLKLTKGCDLYMSNGDEMFSGTIRDVYKGGMIRVGPNIIILPFSEESISICIGDKIEYSLSNQDHRQPVSSLTINDQKII